MMSRTIEEIIVHIRAVISNPNISTTLIQTEDLEKLCNAALITPISLETAPKLADEILLVSIQLQTDNSKYISICNGCWSAKEEMFVLGKRGSELNKIGDACSTHWLPRSALGIGQ